ncbi:hypothetical protein HK099_004053 [Clydaea vesicula]|uniref:Uncharacterized protein n=1 Tax=Clydaea vesicula TaxID=447962 RepID=A0AAD5XYG3_9FUNG|nr:hypothetical protein HK099_004053 [Clydaea vesicula]
MKQKGLQTVFLRILLTLARLVQSSPVIEQGTITLSEEEGELQELLEFLEPSKGSLDLAYRTATLGLINLEQNRQNGNQATATCQTVLEQVYKVYIQECAFQGKVEYTSDVKSTVQNWIHPLCTISSCSKISYNFQKALQATCQNPKEVYINNGSITGLTPNFFQNYRLDKQNGASQVCKMEKSEGTYCAATFFNNLQKMFIQGVASTGIFGYCNNSCAWSMSKVICDP